MGRVKKGGVMTAKIAQPIIDLYDAYTHGAMARRAFLSRLARLAGGTAAASAILPLLVNDYAKAAIIAADDPRLQTGERIFAAGGVSISAYSARPAEAGDLPAVIVIHENRGLNPHIRDVARRVALEGFAAFAVDMLSPMGGTPADEDKAREMIGTLKREDTAARLGAIVEELSQADQRNVGAIGFCWGGGMVNALAAASPLLDAGVVYYGMQPSAAEAARIKAALLIHYAGEDQRINAGMADYEAALKAAGVEHETHLYEGAQHAFNNDTNAARYDEKAAELAWARTAAFLKEKLG